jgi:hypothetical protein
MGEFLEIVCPPARVSTSHHPPNQATCIVGGE